MAVTYQEADKAAIRAYQDVMRAYWMDLVEKHGWSIAVIAQTTGLSRDQVYRRMKYANVSKPKSLSVIPDRVKGLSKMTVETTFGSFGLGGAGRAIATGMVR